MSRLLRGIRMAAGWSVADAVDGIGLSNKTITNIEKGRLGNMKDATVEKILIACNNHGIEYDFTGYEKFSDLR